MTYEKLRWPGHPPHEPVLVFSEIDDERWEVRKVEVFADGSMGYADESTPPDAKTLLADQRQPTKEETEKTTRLVVDIITADAFDLAWRAARSGETWNL